MEESLRPSGNSDVRQVIAKLENDARNQLHSVMGMLELIAHGPLTLSQSDCLHSCKCSMDRLLRSIQNVSALLSPQAEEPQISVFDLREAVADISNSMETLAQLKGLGLRYEIRPGVPSRVEGDRGHLQDILIRLLDNAIRFTEHGHIRLVVDSAPQNTNASHVQFDITDTGPGIPREIISLLADPGAELSAEHGLGLRIVRKLVLGMRGDLTIGSGESGGARVTVSLPFRETRTASDAADVTAGAEKPLNILVAEDSDDCYFVLEAYLSEQKHRLTRALNGARAVELFKTGQYDLIFMDIHMPDMDGYSATRAIRTWETGCARARVPIVVLSSDSYATQVHNGAKVGCSAYLTKPVSSVALLTVLRRFAGANAASTPC